MKDKMLGCLFGQAVGDALGFGSEYETLLGAFDKDIANLKRRVGKDRALGTYKLQVRSRNYVADFLQMNFRRTDISMQELTPDFIKEFAVYLANERGLANSTIWLSCMHLKGVVARAHDNGKIQRNVFAQYHISPKCKERTFLTEEELKTVMTHEFEDANLAFICDLFVFMNFTTLSFVDLKELTTDNIVEVNGEKWIEGKRHKTGVPYQVKLLAVPLQIIERYRDYPKANPKSVFGEVNYRSVCKKLKPVMKECSMLRDCMESDRSEFVIVYGRRRVGKTFLIDQYFKMNYDFSFVGSHRSTQRVQLRNYGKAMKQYAGLKTVPKYADWFDAFDALEEHLSNLPAK